MTNDIQILRKEIDRIDKDLLQLLSKRIAVVTTIGELKKQNGTEVLDKKRRDTMLEQKKEIAGEYGLDKAFVSKLFLLIHDHAVKLQKKQQ